MKLFFSIFCSLLISGLMGTVCFAGQPGGAPGAGLNIFIKTTEDSLLIDCQGADIDPLQKDAILIVGGESYATSAIFRDDEILVPLRTVSDTLGALAAWKKDSKTVELTKGKKIISLTIGESKAIVNDQPVTLSVPAELVGADTYVPLKFTAEHLDYNAWVRKDFLVFTDYLRQKYENIRDKSGMTAVFIERKKTILPPLSFAQASLTVQTQTGMKLIQNYQPSKERSDLYFFMDEITYKANAQPLGRYHPVEIHFYDQWSKRFESIAYVDGYTGRAYMGDSMYGYTDNFSSYIKQKYDNHLPIENKRTVVVPFSQMNLDREGDFIQVNFPEQIHSNALKETYFFHGDMKKTSGRIFLSHGNTAGQAIDYIIRFQNLSGKSNKLRYIEDKAIHTTELYQEQVVREHLERFYKQSLDDRYAEIILEPEESFDTAINGIQDGQFFTALLDYAVTEDISVTVFAVSSGEAVELTPDIPYSFDYMPTSYEPIPTGKDKNLRYYSVYSGTGEGYRILAEGELTASLMTGAEGVNIAYETGGSVQNINHRNGLGEIVDITLITPGGENGDLVTAGWGGGIRSASGADRTDPNNPKTYGNAGNWGLEYEITVQLTNDTDSDKVFKCEVTPTYQTVWAFINEGGAASATLSNKKYQETFRRQRGEDYDRIHIGSGIRSGNVGSVIVKPGESVEYRYTYVLGTDCESNVFHVWTCTDL